jgi:heme/copper-type cytochrome/quinol oxidase subunit 2
LWGVLLGLLVGVAALIASTLDSSSSYGKGVLFSPSRLSSSSSSRKLEFVALFVPTIGVVALNQLVLTTPIVDVTSESTIEIVGLQWYWTIDQIDVSILSALTFGDLFGVTLSNTAVIAVGNFLVVLSAVDVIHAIALPTLAVKADAIPGRCVVVRVNCEMPGTFVGQCSELCGANHGFMPLGVSAVCLKSLSALHNSEKTDRNMPCWAYSF